MSKKLIYQLGLLTLLGFPLVGLLLLWFFKDADLLAVLQLDRIFHWYTLLGVLVGLLFSYVSLQIFNSDFFVTELKQQLKLIASLNLSIADKVFLSFCAGFGEEILFRSSIQEFLGVFLTTFIFIAIHGYLNPKKWKIVLYGLFLFPFILLLGYGIGWFGLWFCIGAHFSYDLLLFLNIDPLDYQI